MKYECKSLIFLEPAFDQLMVFLSYYRQDNKSTTVSVISGDQRIIDKASQILELMAKSTVDPEVVGFCIHSWDDSNMFTSFM